jgi:hypothetical protein
MVFAKYNVIKQTAVLASHYFVVARLMPSIIKQNIKTMKKLLVLSIFACFICVGAFAQVSQGNSAYGHSHKKYHKHYTVTRHTVTHPYNDVNHRNINYSNRTETRTVRTDNDRNRMDRDRNANRNNVNYNRTETRTDINRNRTDRDRVRDNRSEVRQTTSVHKEEGRKEDHDKK